MRTGRECSPPPLTHWETAGREGDSSQGGSLAQAWQTHLGEAAPIFPGVQSDFVPLVGADREGKNSKQRPTHGTNGKSEIKV